MYRPWLILVCLCPCLLPYPSAWAADQAYLQQLTREAGQRQLQAAPEWRALLHYKADLLGGGYTSEAVTPGFFLAAGGRTHPGAELRATLASFFAAPAPGDPDAGSQCRFIARYRWLKQELHFDPARLPQTPCPHFDAWYRAIDPGRLVLIFPAAYVNNPSSMFGHTFLRFDHPRQPRNTHLESYAVNFAAQTRESNGLIFAIKGLTGLYPGEYSLEPYYKAVNAYSDIENRDIWEYRLDYSPVEIRRILEHVWELRDVAFRYYFFNRNCSYAVLALLDVARPQLRLTHRFVYQVIPSNTVKAVLAQQGVLLETTYRPSLLARTRYRLQHMDPHDQRLALDVATRQLPPDASAITALAPERQALIYESAADYLLYQGNRGQLPKRDYGPLTLAILRARSRVQSHEVLPSMPIPDTDPVLGHGSSRSSLDVGRLAGEDYREIELRAAYHDLLDPPAGFVDGAQIDMFALALRDSGPRHNTRLEYLNLVDILSVSPRDMFFKPLSWQLSIGWSHEWISTTQRPLVGDVHGGLGGAWRLGDDVMLYAMAEGSLLTNGGVPKGFDLGVGPETGLLWHPTGRWNMLAEVKVQRYARHLGFTAVRFRLGQNFVLTRDLSLRLDLTREGDIHAPANDASLKLLWYF